MVVSGFRNTYPNTALLAAISMQIVEGAAAYSQHRTDFPHLQESVQRLHLSSVLLPFRACGLADS